MKNKHKLKFKYDIENFQAGSVHELELTDVELERLLRRGCIFASEDAKLTKEVKKDLPKIEKIKEEEKPEKELDNVDNKKPRKRSKVQTKSANKE